MEESATFHESWYRIADQHISLRPGVHVRRQMFRGQKWFVLFDPFSNQFFRLRPAAYEFIARLDGKHTVEEVWSNTMERDPDNAPGQEEVIQLLTQLYHANLLHYRLAADSTKLFERYRERKQKLLKATLMNIMFIRIPLFDPDSFLKKCLPIVRRVISPVGAVIWGVVVLAGIKLAIDNAQELLTQSQGILAPSNLFLLYVSLVFVKAFHEFGHAFVCRRYGGEVHTMGVMFLIFNPLPFMDATSSWSFRSRWQRAFVGAAGMIAEIFIAAIMMFVWAKTGPGTLHSIAYNMVFIASVSTILFNINPLLRFDGYYILSDVLDIPNLHVQAKLQLTHLVERYAFGCRKSKSPASSRKEAGWLTGFGIASNIYRVIVFTGILLFVADRFLLAGIIMAVICVISWVFAPIVQLIKYLATNPRLERTRLRAVGVCLGILLVGFFILYVIPVPNSFRAPGILEAKEREEVVAAVGGHVTEVLSPLGAEVKKGDPLLRMENDELDIQILNAEAKLAELKALRQRVMQVSTADLKPVESKMISVAKQLARYMHDRQSLTIHARGNGTWVAPQLEDMKGMWIPRGAMIGQVINNQSLYFSAVVPQQETFRLFAEEVRSYDIRLRGETDVTIRGTDWEIIPVEQTMLPSAALGWTAGGDIAVDTSDPHGMKAAEPFYEVHIQFDQTTDATMYHGKSGRIRFRLPSESILKQAWRHLRQLLQKRYQL